jgi:hypothetical protein
VLKGDNGIVNLERGDYICSQNGASFFSWLIATSPSVPPFELSDNGWLKRREQLNKNTKYFVVLCPITLDDGRFAYYLITHTWKEMIANGTIVRPRVSVAAY